MKTIDPQIDEAPWWIDADRNEAKTSPVVGSRRLAENVFAMDCTDCTDGCPVLSVSSATSVVKAVFGFCEANYSFDLRNRLTDVAGYTSGNVKPKAIRCSYDTSDRRIKRELDANGDNTYESAEQYVYDGVAAQELVARIYYYLTSTYQR